MLKRNTMPILLAVLIISTSVLAQPATAPADNSPAIVTRVYDITDLLLQRHDYPVPPTHAESAASPFFPPPAPSSQPSRDELVDVFIRLIQDTVASDSWRDNGGAAGSIRELNGKLVVSQTAENHRALDALLQDLRQDHGRMVVVRATWLLLDPKSAPEVEKHVGGKELPAVDDQLMDPKNVYCAAQTTCFSGQTVHVTSGRKRTVVTDLTPVVGSNSVGYDPTVQMMHSGVTLQVMPLLEPAGADSRVVVDLQSCVTELDAPDGKFIVPTTQPSQPSDAIDRTNEVDQELRTTVRLPLGVKVVVGGMTLEPATKDQPSKQLYLVIQADAVK